MKHKLYMIIISVFLLMVSGCTKTSVSSEKVDSFTKPQYEWGKVSGKTLRVWGTSPDLERSYVVKAFKRYEELTGNHLEVVQYKQDEIQERIQEGLAGKRKLPDIFVTYGGTSMDVYDPDEVFYDFSDAEWVKDLTSVSINQTVYHGKVVGLPFWEASISGTLYNKELFEKYHLNVPTTQEEFMEVCDKLLKQGIAPVYMPAKEISMLLYQFPMDSIVEDSQVLAALNDFKIGYQDLPQMKEIVKWYKTMAEKGYFGKSYLYDDWSNMSEALQSEKYAMLLCWDTWLYTDFKGDPDKFGIFPAFMGVPENGTFEGPNLNLFAVNRHSENVEAAVDFITFLADPYNYNYAFEEILTAPVFKKQVDSMSTPQYLENERLIEKHYHDSIAWLRIKGFSQMDAKCIYEYIHPDTTLSVDEVLQKMDVLRRKRVADGS